MSTYSVGELLADICIYSGSNLTNRKNFVRRIDNLCDGLLGYAQPKAPLTKRAVCRDFMVLKIQSQAKLE